MALNDGKHLSSGNNHRVHILFSYAFASMINTWKRTNRLTVSFFSFRKIWIFITILLASSILIDNTSFAQTLPKSPPLPQSMTNSRPPSPTISNTQTRTTHDLHAVKITSPAKGQEVAVGKEYMI
jgi:hypothetical protein